jgi:hypothetical protein
MRARYSGVEMVDCRGGDDMGCRRCQGLMVRERLMDLRSDSGCFVCPAWRCVVCGDIVDPVILVNRHRRVAYRRVFRRYAAMVGA